MPKSTKRFILSNSTLNAHGFRVLTEGVDLTEFLANPIMLWNHTRPDGTPDEKLPIGFWDDIKKEGDNITGVPNFDDNDPLAMKLYNKVEHGTLRAASAGVMPLELSNHPGDMLEGQTNPTYKRSKFKEASLVDIGSNAGAVTLYDNAGKMVTLSAGNLSEHFKNLLNDQNKEMKILTLAAPAVFALLKLDPEKATEADALAEVTKIVNLNNSQTAQIITLKDEKKIAEDKLTELTTLANEGKITKLVDEAVTARKITAGQKPSFVKLAAADFESTKELLEGMKGSTSVANSIAENLGDADATEVAKLMKLSWDELFNGQGLTKLKALSPDSYKAKFKEAFGKEPV